MRTRHAVAGTLVLTAAIAGCGNGNSSRPVTSPQPSGITARDLGDHYPDVATYCDGTTRVYVTARDYKAGVAIAVIPNDPRCADGAVGE